jgi:hypothetical protein
MAMTIYEDSDPLADLTEDEIAQLMQLGALPEEQKSLIDQLSSARELRNREGPQGIDTGRVFTAANPLEHAAHAYQGIKAGRQIDDLLKKQQEILLKQTDGRSAFLKALRRKPQQIEMTAFEPQMEMPEGNF